MCHGQILSNAMRKARKEHHCYDCSRMILPGQVYQYQVQVDGGSLETFKVCARCASRLAALDLDGDDACHVDFKEAAKEQARTTGWKAFLKELRAAREKLFGSKRDHRGSADAPLTP